MDDIKQLREKTGAGIMDAKRALEESGGEMNKAEAWVVKRGIMKAEKKADRETAEGVVYAYIHHDGKSGAMVKLLCETDFVARTDDFKNLAKEVAMQVTSMKAKTVKDLLEQTYVRDPKKTMSELVKEVAGKLGENIQVGEMQRMEL
jgi:elongation factor Ts